MTLKDLAVGIPLHLWKELLLQKSWLNCKRLFSICILLKMIVCQSENLNANFNNLDVTLFLYHPFLMKILSSHKSQSHYEITMLRWKPMVQKLKRLLETYWDMQNMALNLMLNLVFLNLVLLIALCGKCNI